MGKFFGDAESDRRSRADDVLSTVMHALAQEKCIGLLVLDDDLRVTQSRLHQGGFLGLTFPDGCRIDDMVPTEDTAAVRAGLRRVLSTGRPLLSYRQRLGRSGNLIASLSALPLNDTPGGPITGLAVALVHVPVHTRHLDLLTEAASAIGSSLDVWETARQLCDTLVPAMGDQDVLYLAKDVFAGEDPPSPLEGEVALCCAARSSADGTWSDEFIKPGADFPPVPDTAAVRSYQRGESYVVPDRQAMIAALDGDLELLQHIVPSGATSCLRTSLMARGLILGDLAVWRSDKSDPFDNDDLLVLKEIAAHAALSVDNARRYTRERNSSLTLQHSMLPEVSTDTAALQAAGVYLPPAAEGQEVGGDWYDVIPLSPPRVGLVVGDVVGHGLHAAATMGRMRTAMQALADLDPRPDEMLTHLSDIVRRVVGDTDPTHEEALASTCLYAVYDPVARRCAMASAGHPPPAVIRPDATVDFVDVDPGPPLGFGGLPFEVTEIELAPGSILALYTDGLVEQNHDLSEGMETFRKQLASTHPTRGSLQEMASDVLSGISPARLEDDVTLLLAQVRDIPGTDIASWPIPADPAAVTLARDLATGQLTPWHLDELAFTTELIVSELVTNAIRYAAGPITLRLIRNDRDSTLICEVSDPSDSQPRLRQARSTDEGGRGLFLVAQLAARWGSRYNDTGKTIWTEQSASAAAG